MNSSPRDTLQPYPVIFDLVRVVDEGGAGQRMGGAGGGGGRQEVRRCGGKWWGGGRESEHGILSDMTRDIRCQNVMEGFSRGKRSRAEDASDRQGGPDHSSETISTQISTHAHGKTAPCRSFPVQTAITAFHPSNVRIYPYTASERCSGKQLHRSAHMLALRRLTKCVSGQRYPAGHDKHSLDPSIE